MQGSRPWSLESKMAPLTLVFHVLNTNLSILPVNMCSCLLVGVGYYLDVLRPSCQAVSAFYISETVLGRMHFP